MTLFPCAQLVFAVLLDRSGVTADTTGGQLHGVTVINKPEHQLPLAVVTLAGAPFVPPDGWSAQPDPEELAGSEHAPAAHAPAAHAPAAHTHVAPHMRPGILAGITAPFGYASTARRGHRVRKRRR
jgi:hypothetical protein